GSLRAAGQLRRRLDDDLAAPARELLEPELLDLALRVEPELALDADLDPEPLAVEPVLVALVEPAERLVALEDVLQRPPPRGVDGKRLVVGHRAVDDRPAGPAFVERLELLEGTLSLPALEHLELEGIGIGYLGKSVEHRIQSRSAELVSQRLRYLSQTDARETGAS